MEDIVDGHYRRLAQSYNDFLYYSPEFIRCLTSKMVEKLRLSEDDVLVDLGCGTAMYSLDMLQLVPLRSPVIGVDPFREMLDQIPQQAPVTRVCEDALAFSARPGTYNKVLMKEAIHHVGEKEQLFSNLHQQLPDGGLLLLVHVPPRLQYPLFSEALQRCLSWHADPEELVVLLGGVGFDVARDAMDYRHSIPKEDYFRMVEGRYMSVLSSFSDEEIRQGLAEMADTYADRSVLNFLDHFDYITARKS
ncbi:MAG: class I SAM-dependent methyltransferase [Dehalococcoidia bacterium]